MNKAVKRAYTAGLIDGEGTITIDKRIRPNTIWYQLHIRVAMTYRESLEKLQRWWGGHLNDEPYQHKNSNAKWHGYYAWQLWTKQAEHFLSCIEPYLILKKDNARIGIAFQKRIRKGFRPSQEELQEREKLYQQMKSFNDHSLHLQRLSEEDSVYNTGICDSPALLDGKQEEFAVGSCYADCNPVGTCVSQ